jgi:predicted phage terminase large subunit-like protein
MNQSILDAIKKDPTVRKELSRRSLYYFFHIYFSHHIEYPTAEFQKEIMDIAEDLNQKMAVIVAFRGSGKSTVISLAYVIWSVIGKQNLKFVLLVSQTQGQSKQLLSNIKIEFENNELLRRDFGSFEESNDEWRANSLVLSRYNAKIMAVSTGESIRGYRYGQHRPELIIFDDIEDNDSVRTKEGRDKTYQFVTSQAIPAGDINTKVIMIGNLLHEDSVIKRFINEINLKSRDGIYRFYPFLDDRNSPLWPEKFNNRALIENQKMKVGNEKVFRREFMLEIVPEDDQIIDLNWIHYYDQLPVLVGNDLRFTAVGVDLAISDKDAADYTAFVSAMVFGYSEKMKIYILPNPVNKKMNFPTTEIEMKNLVERLGGKNQIKIYIENVGYQLAFVQVLQNQGYAAEGVPVNSASKRERLTFVSHLVQNGTVLFPSKGAEDLITQLTGFGIETHDDLADAFSILIKKIREDNNEVNNIISVKFNRDYCEVGKSTDWAEREDNEMLPNSSNWKSWRIN